MSKSPTLKVHKKQNNLIITFFNNLNEIQKLKELKKLNLQALDLQIIQPKIAINQKKKQIEDRA